MKPASALSFYTLIVLLLLAGITLILQRHWVYEVPLFHGETQTVWSVEALVEFEAGNQPVKVSMARPADQEGFTLLRQSGASPGYGLHFIDGPDPRAEWTIRSARGVQQLYFQVDVLESDMADSQLVTPPPLTEPDWQEPYEIAIHRLTRESWEASADNFSFARELIKRLTEEESPQHIQWKLNKFRSTTQSIVRWQKKLLFAIVFGTASKLACLML